MCIQTIRMHVKYCAVHSFYAQFRTLQSTDTEQVQCGQLRTFCCKSTVVHVELHGSAQSLSILHGSGHLCTCVPLPIRMCPPGCAVWYGAVRYHADIYTAHTHGTMQYLNVPLVINTQWLSKAARTLTKYRTQQTTECCFLAEKQSLSHILHNE